MESIELRGVTKQYKLQNNKDFFAVDHVDMVLKKGEILSVIGDSGSGKSTLARLMLGLDQPTDGKVFIDEEDTTLWRYNKWRLQREKLQGVFQDSSGTLNQMHSTLRNVEQALRHLTKMNSVDRKNRVLELMELVHMDEKLLKVPTRNLSGGEQRRLSLLRALAIRPKYLILDEVISGLDRAAKEAVLAVIKTYQSNYHCACLFITHDKKSAYEISDRIIEMKHGKIIKIGERLSERTGEHEKQIS